MNRKKITIAILVIFLTATLLPSSTVAQNSGLIPAWAPSITELETSTEKIDIPLNPEEEKEIDITVKFKLDMGNLLFRFFTKRRIGRVLLFEPQNFFKFLNLGKYPPQAVISLDVEHPEWCTAVIDPDNVSFVVENTFQTVETVLTISDIQPDAPALELEEIRINAEFGGVGKIKPSNANLSISILAAYLPKITFETEEEQYVISPINETIIPIDVKNEGNGESTISIEFDEVPEDWNVSLDKEEITLDVDDSETINLFVTPVKTFTNKTVKLKFTPVSTSEENVDDKYLEGEPVYLGITLLNDGSLEDENGELPLFEIAIIIIVAAIVIFILLLFFLRRRQ